MKNIKLAAYTFNQFIAPYDTDPISGFRAAEPGIFKTIECAAGFLGRSGYEGDEAPESWGEQVFPACWENANGDGWAPSTLSLWTTAEALMAATYHGSHGAILSHGKAWHVAADHIPEYVLWWVIGDTRPTWADAVLRFEQLMANGPTPHAFTFKTLFTAEGTTIKADIQVMKDLARQNAIATRA